MNINYTNVVKKIVLEKPIDRNLFFNKRKKRLQYIFESCKITNSKIPTIHVVGTKGKGSTSTFLANILKEAGYTTGLFTSPHLHKITERIKVNLEDIPENSFTNIFDTFVGSQQSYNLFKLGKERSVIFMKLDLVFSSCVLFLSHYYAIFFKLFISKSLTFLVCTLVEIKHSLNRFWKCTNRLFH